MTHLQLQLAMAIAALLIIKVHCKDEQAPLRTCPSGLWVVKFDNTFREGQASVHFNIPHIEQGSNSKLEAFLGCDDLIINGTGHRILQKTSRAAKFQFSLPEAEGTSELEKREHLTSHSCTYELVHSSVHVQHCKLSVKTLKQRILPSHNSERDGAIISEIKVLRRQAQVRINFHNSPNDVVETEAQCAGEDSEAESFPLNAPGLHPSSLALDFEPDCDNHTVRAAYSKHRDPKCSLRVFAMCQEGRVEIRNMQVEFDKDAMFCGPLKPLYILAIEHLEIKFMIESKPVVVLLLTLIINGILYTFLIPFVGVAAVRTMHREIKRCRDGDKREPKQRANGQNEGQLELETYASEATVYEEVDYHSDGEPKHQWSSEGEEIMEIYDLPDDYLPDYTMDSPITTQPHGGVYGQVMEYPPSDATPPPSPPPFPEHWDPL